MISIEAPGAVRTMMISFRRGDYIIEELRELFKKEGVDAALITSGIGSFDVCKLHTPSQARVYRRRSAILSPKAHRSGCTAWVGFRGRATYSCRSARHS